MRPIAQAGLLLLLLCGALRAQITVAPAILTTTDDARAVSYVVHNGSDVEQEFSISFRFGYPVADSADGMMMVYGHALPLAGAELTEWARAYPARFRLRPGATQTVRLLVEPPGHLAPGMYWTRIVTASTPAVTQGPTEVRLEQVATLLFKRGPVQGNAVIDELRVRSDSAGLRVQVRLRRTGTAPFLGTVTASLLDRQGRAVASVHVATSVYTEAMATLSLTVPRSIRGPCTVRAVAAPGREDVQAGFADGSTSIRETVVDCAPGQPARALEARRLSSPRC